MPLLKLLRPYITGWINSAGTRIEFEILMRVCHCVKEWMLICLPLF